MRRFRDVKWVAEACPFYLLPQTTAVSSILHRAFPPSPQDSFKVLPLPGTTRPQPRIAKVRDGTGQDMQS